MKIVVSGGTGFIGKPLCRSLSASGHDVILLTRQSNVQLTSTGTHVRVVHWDGMTRGPWEFALNEADAVINLAGKPIADRRWTVASKKAIVQSRIGATRLLVEACASLPNVRPSWSVDRRSAITGRATISRYAKMTLSAPDFWPTCAAIGASRHGGGTARYACRPRAYRHGARKGRRCIASHASSLSSLSRRADCPRDAMGLVDSSGGLGQTSPMGREASRASRAR